MKKCITIILGFIIVLAFCSCQSIPITDNERSATLPFENIISNDITKASMLIEPPGLEIELYKEQISELVLILKSIQLNKQITAVDLDGQFVQFVIEKIDGTIITLAPVNPYFIMDNNWYETEYEPCEDLNKFANKIAGTGW